MKYSKTAILLLATCLTTPAFAQDASPPAAAETADDGAAIIVTGSRIKQDPAKALTALNSSSLTCRPTAMVRITSRPMRT
jgi:iron complex outermembrane recepter protein